MRVDHKRCWKHGPHMGPACLDCSKDRADVARAQMTPIPSAEFKPRTAQEWASRYAQKLCGVTPQPATDVKWEYRGREGIWAVGTTVEVEAAIRACGAA